MWTIKSIEAKNFFSYKDFKYGIVNNELTMIYGKNLDVSAKKSNGSGKSVLLDAISFSITGDCLRKIKSIKKTISNGEKECYAIIELANKVTKSNMTIKRMLSTKSSQKVEIIYNGEDQSQLKDLHPRESDKFIEEKLGVSFEDLLNYYVISKFRYQSLFLANDATKKDVINRFSKANLIDEVFVHFDNDASLYKDQLNQLNDNLVKQVTSLEIYDQQLEDLIAKQSDDVKKLEIEDIEIQIKDKRVNISALNYNINTLNDEIDYITNEILSLQDKVTDDLQLKEIDATILKISDGLDLKKLEYDDISSYKYLINFEILESKEAKINAAIVSLRSSVKEFDKLIKELESYIAGEIECPKCKHHFILADKDFNIEDAKLEIEAYIVEKKNDEAKIDENNKLLQKVINDRDELDKKISNEQKAVKDEILEITTRLNLAESKKLELTRSNSKILLDINKLESQIKTKELNISDIYEQIRSEEKYILSYNEQIEQIKNEKNDKEVNELNEKIENVNRLIDIINTEIELTNLNSSKLEEWRNKFKRFKSYLANNSINQIQQQSNFFLKKMKSELLVFIDGFRELSNGKLKEEITVEISRDGIQGEEFAAFSGGEKSIADLSAILAMQNIINSTSSSGGLNFLAIDEVLESLDAEGMDNVTKCLNELSQTILLIAHSAPDESIDCNKLVIEKRNGISNIVNNDIKILEKELI